MSNEAGDVWVFANGSRVIFRGSLADCAEKWSSAEGLDKWHGSVRYESGPRNYDQQADALLGLMDFMEDPESGWKEPRDFEPMRQQARELGRAAGASLDAMILRALEPAQPKALPESPSEKSIREGTDE